MILVEGGTGIEDIQSEAVHQGQLLLHGIGVVHVLGMLHVLPVGEILLDQVPAVGGGVDQDVVRLGLEAALDHSLQVLVFDLKLLKGEIIHINDELVVPVLHLRDDIGKILELVLVDLNESQSLGIELVESGLHCGGLSGTGIAVEQHVVGGLPLHEGAGIVADLLLLVFVAHEIRIIHLIQIVDGDQLRGAVLPVPDPEGLVETEHAHTVVPVEAGHRIMDSGSIRLRQQLLGQSIDGLRNIAEVHALMLLDGLVLLQHREAVDGEGLFQCGEIVVQKLLQIIEIVVCKVHCGARRHFPLLADEGQRIFVGHDPEANVVGPEVPGEAVGGGGLHDFVDLVEDHAPECVLILVRDAELQLLQNIRQRDQHRILLQTLVYNEIFQ